jgi:adenosylhomocysteine nucleosidase
VQKLLSFAPMRRPFTLVLGAVPWEIKPLRLELQDAEEHQLFGFPFVRGRIEKLPVLIAITGVGKANAAMISTLFITQFKPVRLFYTGTAARVNHALRTGDIILGKKTVHHDFGSLQADGMLYRKVIGPLAGKPTNYQYGADSKLLGLAQSAAKSYQPATITANEISYVPEIRPGIICSGDLFGMTEAKLKDIRTKLKAELVEMEGAAVGQVCHEFNLPHLVIRGGSNLAQENPGNDYKRLGQIAARSAALFTLHVLKQLSNERAR